MAVRHFEAAPWSGRIVEAVPAPPRRLVRRTRTRWAVTGIALVSVPFLAALAVLGVAR